MTCIYAPEGKSKIKCPIYQENHTCDSEMRHEYCGRFRELEGY